MNLSNEFQRFLKIATLGATLRHFTRLIVVLIIEKKFRSNREPDV